MNIDVNTCFTQSMNEDNTTAGFIDCDNANTTHSIDGRNRAQVSDIQEGDLVSSTVLNSDKSFEQDLENKTEVNANLYGNAEDGYQFEINNLK